MWLAKSLEYSHMAGFRGSGFRGSDWLKVWSTVTWLDLEDLLSLSVLLCCHRRQAYSLLYIHHHLLHPVLLLPYLWCYITPIVVGDEHTPSFSTSTTSPTSPSSLPVLFYHTHCCRRLAYLLPPPPSPIPPSPSFSPSLLPLPPYLRCSVPPVVVGD